MIAIITTEQKNILVGQTYDGVCYFNPIQDLNDNWIISEQEINQSSLQWLKDLPLTDYLPKQQTTLF
jgi:hypothetical protein